MIFKLRIYWLAAAALLALLGGSLQLVARSNGHQAGQELVSSKRPATSAATNSSGPGLRSQNAYVVRAVAAAPRFKTQVKCARRFCRERQFRSGWSRQHRVAMRPAAPDKVKDDKLGYNPRAINEVSTQSTDPKRVGQDAACPGQLTQPAGAVALGASPGWAPGRYRSVANPRHAGPEDWKVKRHKTGRDQALRTAPKERASSYSPCNFVPLPPSCALPKTMPAPRAREAAGSCRTLPATILPQPGAALLVVVPLRQRLPGNASEGQAPAASPAQAPVPKLNAIGNSYDPPLRDLELLPIGLVEGETPRRVNGLLAARLSLITLNAGGNDWHDAPPDELFCRRTFGHRYVRLAGPVKSTGYLLRNDPGWSAAARA